MNFIEYLNLCILAALWGLSICRFFPTSLKPAVSDPTANSVITPDNLQHWNWKHSYSPVSPITHQVKATNQRLIEDQMMPISMQLETVSIDFSYFLNTSARHFFPLHCPGASSLGSNQSGHLTHASTHKCQTWELLNFHQDSDWQGSPLTFSIFQSWKFQHLSSMSFSVESDHRFLSCHNNLTTSQFCHRARMQCMHGNDIIF